jgi:hypothetical protein
MSVIIGTPPAQGYGGQWTSNIAGKIGAADFTLLYDGTGSGDGKMHCFTRLSGAIVWNELDLAHAPHLDISNTYFPAAGGTLQYCSYIDGTTLFLLVLRQHSTAGPNFFIDGWDIFSFDSTTGLWGTSPTTFANGAGGTTIEINYSAGAVPGAVSQCNICMIVRGTNNYLFYHSGTSENIAGTLYGRLYRSTFNGTTFGTDLLIPVLAGVHDRPWIVGGCHDGSGFEHYFFYTDNGLPTQDLFHIGESAGSFSSIQIVNQGYPQDLYNVGTQGTGTLSRPIVYRDNLGNEQIGIAGEFYFEPFDSTHQVILFIKAPSQQSPAWVAHQVTFGIDGRTNSAPSKSAVTMFPVDQNGSSQCISVAAESNGNLVLAWATTDTTAKLIGHIYYATSVDGATWIFPGTSIIDAAQLSTNDNPMLSVFVYADSDPHGISIIGNQDSFFDFTEESQWAHLLFAPPGPTCSLHATKLSITKGESTILFWTTTGSPNLGTIDNGIGQVIMPSGSINVMPTVNTTYILTVSNENGNSTCTVTITVSECNLSSQFEQDYSFFI